MRIIVAKTAGYCYGVKRATEMAFETVRGGDGPIYSLGDVIHNPQVVSKLVEAGVKLVGSVREIKSGTAIIPAHGRAASDIEYLASRGIRMVDATCPHVRVPQRAIAELAGEGRTIVFFGDPDHPEVRAVSSFASGARVIFTAGAEDLPHIQRTDRVGVIAQTTQSVEKFERLVEELESRVDDLVVKDTICNATRKRQQEAETISKGVDRVIVIGARHSANTKKLAEICRRNCKDTIHIESASELDGIGFEKTIMVAVTSGASTPDWVINDVLEKLRRMT